MTYVDYTVVIASCISGFSAITAAVLSAWIARQVRTPSGDTLGEVAERTHDNAAVIAFAVKSNGSRFGIPTDDTKKEPE